MPRRLTITVGAATVVALAPAVAGAASVSRYATRALLEPAKPGLTVTGALSDLAATSSARVVVPTAWQKRSAPAGRLRLHTKQNANCSYGLTYRVSSVIAPTAPASDYATGLLPAANARYVIDSGTRGSSAFRVVRRARTSDGRVHVDAVWAGVLTRRADVVPAGQTAWTLIRVAAVSDKGDECHSGTWRQSLGPAIGDSLAVARTHLHFSKAR
jgi:hypothetical protein